MVTCSICETTGGSCRIPANANNVASLVTTKGVISSEQGWTAQHINHRPGILCRTSEDAAKVLDAMKNPETGYFDLGDMFTALPKSFIPNEPYESFILDDDDLRGNRYPLSGTRIGVVREFFITPNLNNVAINDLIDREVKTVLRNKLGATLVESIDPLCIPTTPRSPTCPSRSRTRSRGSWASTHPSSSSRPSAVHSSLPYRVTMSRRRTTWSRSPSARPRCRRT